MHSIRRGPEEEGSVEEYAVRYTVVIEKDGEPVLDATLASLLRGVREHGSLLAAARALGVPYSRAWDQLSRAERLLGAKLVETWRGGARRGGARLTPLAEKLLALYEEAEHRLERCETGPQAPRMVSAEEPDLVVAHSHDPLLGLVLDRLRGEGLRVENVCAGSGHALAMLSLGEADVACIHLYDPETGEYNRPYLERYWLGDAVLLGGFQRQLVLALRPGLEAESLEDVLEMIARGKLRIVNRNRGSGTRVLLDHLLRETARRLGLGKPIVRGYDNVAYTHTEAARRVALGRADAALVLRYVAESHGLPYLHVAWEQYECYSPRGRAGSNPVKALAEILSSDWLRALIENSPGYRPLEGPG